MFINEHKKIMSQQVRNASGRLATLDVYSGEKGGHPLSDPSSWIYLIKSQQRFMRAPAGGCPQQASMSRCCQ